MQLWLQEIEAVVPEATKKDIGKAFKTIDAVVRAEEGVRLTVLTVLHLPFFK